MSQNVTGQTTEQLVEQVRALAAAADKFGSELTSVTAMDDDNAILAVFVYAKGEEAARLTKLLDPDMVSEDEEATHAGRDFGVALDYLKQGCRVRRAGWNGKGMWLAYSPGAKALPAEKFWAGPNREYAIANGGTADVLPCITMKTATGEILTGWLASQSDMLACDWEVLP